MNLNRNSYGLLMGLVVFMLITSVKTSAQSSDDLISAQAQIEQAKVLLTTKYTFLVNE